MAGLHLVSLLVLCVILEWCNAFNLPMRHIGLRRATTTMRPTHSRQTLVMNTNNNAEFIDTCETPVLCHFSSPLSAPCTMLRPVLTEVHRRLQGEIELIEIDVDAEPILISKYQLQALPTTILFRKGQEIDRMVAFEFSHVVEAFVREFCNAFRLPMTPLASVRTSKRIAPFGRQQMRLKDAAFDNLLHTSSVPVLVDFYADWCGPCRMLAPVLTELATKMDGIVQITKIDTDKSSELSEKYDIRALPTLILFNNGEEVERFQGYRSAEQLEAIVRQAVGKIEQ